MLQESRYREDGTSTKPTAHMVAADMIEHGIVRNIEDVILQFLQTMNAHNLLMSLRITEYEIAKAHVLFHQTAKIYAHLLRVLVNKAETFCLCLRTVLTFRTFYYKRNERIILPDITEELQTCIWTFLATESICTMLRLLFRHHLITKSFGSTL